MLKASLIVAAILTSAEARPEGVVPVVPIAPGKYCENEPVTAFTGSGHDADLGNFVMTVKVSKTHGDYAVAISNQMPDNPQILSVETRKASILRDGSLLFQFTDGWNNEGRARVHRNGKVVLVMTRTAPMNQIDRNYGTFKVAKANCSAIHFR